MQYKQNSPQNITHYGSKETKTLLKSQITSTQLGNVVYAHL